MATPTPTPIPNDLVPVTSSIPDDLVPAGAPEIHNPETQSWLSKVASYLDPMFGESKGMGVTDNSYMDNGKFVEMPSEQEPGLKKLAANVIETGATIGGGIMGAAGGGLAGGATGPAAPIAAPVLSYVGSAVGAEAGNLGALQFNKDQGLRPLTPEYDPVEQARLKNLGPRLAVDLLAPVALKASAKLTNWAAGNMTEAFSRTSRSLKAFLDPNRQLAKALTDNPKAYKNDLASKIKQVPEIFEGLPLEIPEKIYEVPGRKKPGLFQASSIDNFFQTIHDNIVGVPGDAAKPGLIKKVGGAIDDILSQVPEKVRHGDLDFSKIKTNAEKFTLPSVTGKNVQNIWEAEQEHLAQQVLTKSEFDQYLIAKQTVGKYDKAVARQGLLGKEVDKELEVDNDWAKDFIHDVETKISNIEYTPQQLREYGTHLDQQARYDMLSNPDRFAQSRAKVYRDLGSVIRNKKYDLVKTYVPDQLPTFKQLNTKYGILSDLAPFTEARAEQAWEAGNPGFTTSSFQSQEKLAMGEATARRMAGVAYPMVNEPLARLKYGLGIKSAPSLHLLQAGSDMASLAGTNIQRVSQNIDKNIPMPWQTTNPGAAPAASGGGALANGQLALPGPAAAPPSNMFPQGVLPSSGKIAAVNSIANTIDAAGQFEQQGIDVGKELLSQGVEAGKQMLSPASAEAQEPPLTPLEVFSQPDFKELIGQLPLSPETQQQLYDARNATPMEKYAALGKAKIEAKDDELFEPSIIQGIHSFIATPNERRLGVIPDQLERQAFGQMLDNEVTSSIERAKLKSALNKDGSVLSIPDKVRNQNAIVKSAKNDTPPPIQSPLPEEDVPTEPTELLVRGVPKFLTPEREEPNTAEVTSSGAESFKRVIQAY